jgi:hypothetical protein
MTKKITKEIDHSFLIVYKEGSVQAGNLKRYNRNKVVVLRRDAV